MQQQYKKLTLRLNEPQYRHLCRQASAAGLKHEPYLRRLLMGSEIRPHPPDAYAGLLQELSAIGNNINQIARLANSRGYTTRSEIQDAAQAAAEALRLVRESF